MSEYTLILAMLCASVLLLIIPEVVLLISKLIKSWLGRCKKKSGISQILVFSAWLIASVWCLRYAVGYYTIISAEPDTTTLTWWEELFNSVAHALQTFSMDEDYTDYILNGKEMLRTIFGADTIWDDIYGLYASALNVIAPVAGGAIIFEILASIFPKIKLFFSYFAVWREKFYFSQLNEGALALASDLCRVKRGWLKKPVIVFADPNVQEDEEKGAKLLYEARQIGAFCIRESLEHLKKNKIGPRNLFLIDEDEAKNIEMLARLAGGKKQRKQKKTQIFLFVNDDAYLQVEKNFRKTPDGKDIPQDDLPTIIPVQTYRNLATNLLVDIPLYEPLVEKRKRSKEPLDLTVTILGTGQIGTQMFLSTYWLGQILNCELNINVLSQETEEEFWSKIDFVNPEIRQTTQENHPVLRINRKGDMSPVYCRVAYTQCDMKSSAFVQSLQEEEHSILNTDYFFVALGADRDNISVADTVRKYVGQHHIRNNSADKTVIAYVVYDSVLSDVLNRTQRYSFVADTPDVLMRAVGSLRELYSVRNIYMTKYDLLAQQTDAAYLSAQNREDFAEKHRQRMTDDYRYWASMARSMHQKYRFFSLGLWEHSLFDLQEPVEDHYQAMVRQVSARYEKLIHGQIEFADDNAKQAHIQLMHKMAWLEHRRWNAFTRVKGFRHTAGYDVYSGITGSYKQMDIKLHPCLVECDDLGIRGVIDEKCRLDESTVFKVADPEQLDLLDELSYDLWKKGLNGYDFKMYDYPVY